MQINIKDDQLDFNRLFPFFFVVSKSLQIVEVGISLEKTYPTIVGKNFKEVFKFKRPWSVRYDFASILEYSNQLFILDSIEKDLKFRWQVIALEASEQLLFIGNPWLASIEEMSELGLGLNDFALHDTLPDTFLVLKASEINTRDIRLLADELKSQKDLLQKVIDLLPHQIFLKDLNSRFILVNKKVEEIFGAPASKIVGKSYNEFHNLPTPEGEYDFSDRLVFATKQKVELTQEPQESFNGATIINNIVKLPFEVNGEIKGVLGIATDISERLASESMLKQSEDRYRALIENALDIIYQTNFTGQFTFLNSLAATVSEYSMEELLQMNYLDLIRADFKEKTKSYYLSDAYLNDTQNTYFEFPLITKYGKEVWISQKVQPLYDGTNIIGYQAVARDVTALKKLELERLTADEELKETASRLKSLIENLNTGILVEDEHRKIVAVNEVFCKMFHIPIPPSDMIGFDCSEATDQAKVLFQDQNQFVNSISKNLKNKTLVTDEEFVMVNNHVLERDFIPIFVKNDYRGQLWSYKDVTLKKFEERELLKAKELAEASSVAKEQFMSTMSHEIRTPMNAVIGMTQILINKSPNPDQVDYLNAIKFSADNLMGLINDILDFSKIQSGKIILETADFDIHDLVHKIQNIYKYQADEKGLSFTISIAPEVNQFLIGDTVRLNQILTNLVGNALKFTENGSVEILIHQTVVSAHKIILHIEVKDTGIGIEQENVNKIFERFTQANSDTTRKYGGTGLGLTITKLLVDLLKGDISVVSKIGKGTSFILELPFEIGSKEKVTQTNLKIKEVESQLQGKRVLLVEDNKLNQVIANEFMKNWGLEVVIANHGGEAISILENEQQIDLVLMDLQMPVMDGYTATEIIRGNEKFRDLPIIALSAATSIEVRNKVVAVGMNDYISKPFEYQYLYKKIAEYITVSPITLPPQTEQIAPTVATDFSIKYYEDFSGGNKDFVKEMIQIYLEETPIILEQLNNFVLETNLDEASAACHKLKTSFTMMGINVAEVKLLEELCRTKSTNLPLLVDLNEKIQKIGLSSLGSLTLFLDNY